MTLSKGKWVKRYVQPRLIYAHIDSIEEIFLNFKKTLTVKIDLVLRRLNNLETTQ